MHRFRNLTPQQQAVFEQIACQQGDVFHQRTIKSLLDKGLIEEYVELYRGVRIKRYKVPIPVHIEWCRWCDKNVLDEEETQ